MSTALPPHSIAQFSHITSHAKFILSAVSASTTRAVVIFFPRTSSAFDFYCRRISRNVIVQRNFFTLPVSFLCSLPSHFPFTRKFRQIKFLFASCTLWEWRKHTQVLCFFFCIYTAVKCSKRDLKRK